MISAIALTPYDYLLTPGNEVGVENFEPFRTHILTHPP